MSTNVNGRPQRKTLANQLDRLDTILDGFADALNEAVADAVKQAVTVAVREALQVATQQLLANPELLRALAGQTAPTPTTQPEPQPEPVKKPSMLRRLVMSIGTRGHRLCKRIKDGVSSACDSVKNRLYRAWQLTRPLLQGCWDRKRTLGLALSVGTVVGVGSYVAGPVIASVACGLCSAALTMAGRVLLPLWQLLRAMTGVEVTAAGLAASETCGSQGSDRAGSEGATLLSPFCENGGC